MRAESIYWYSTVQIQYSTLIRRVVLNDRHHGLGEYARTNSHPRLTWRTVRTQIARACCPYNFDHEF